MSEEVCELADDGGDSGAESVGEGALHEASEGVQGESAGVLVEAAFAATRMTYGEGKAPIYVTAVWLVVVAGLATYMVVYLFADLAAWGAP
jgi:hypothetical protein